MFPGKAVRSVSDSSSKGRRVAVLCFARPWPGQDFFAAIFAISASGVSFTRIWPNCVR